METIIEGLSVYLHGSFFLAFLAAYLGGVFVSFTPCVYPVVPITIAFIGAHGSGSKMKGFVLSCIYVLGMSVTFTALGAVAALTGKLFGQIQTNPWTYFIVANICIFMGLSMLEVFVLPLWTPGFLMKAQSEKKGDSQQLFCRSYIGPCHGPLHGPGFGSAAELCSNQPEHGLRHKPFIYFRPRHGYVPYYTRNICLTTDEHAKIRPVDDKDKPHFRLDITGSRRVFSHTGRESLDMKDFMYGCKSKVCSRCDCGIHGGCTYHDLMYRKQTSRKRRRAALT